jgi:hypothetical protein
MSFGRERILMAGLHARELSVHRGRLALSDANHNAVGAVTKRRRRESDGSASSAHIGAVDSAHTLHGLVRTQDSQPSHFNNYLGWA